jgi:hypothetical protein
MLLCEVARYVARERLRRAAADSIGVPAERDGGRPKGTWRRRLYRIANGREVVKGRAGAIGANSPAGLRIAPRQEALDLPFDQAHEPGGSAVPLLGHQQQADEDEQAPADDFDDAVVAL